MTAPPAVGVEVPRRWPTRTPLFHGALGRGLAWLCFVGPVVTAPVLSREFFELPPATMLVAVAGNAVPGWGVPLVVYAAYRTVLRPILARVRSPVGQALAHLGVSTVAAVSAALALRPWMIWFSVALPPAFGFAAACTVMTWAFVLPAAVIEHHTDREEATARRLQEAREAALRAELDTLRARTRPHFLFNAMNTIAGLIPEDPKLAEALVERLANVLRYVLVHSGDDGVPLARELEMLREYLAVQQARFGDRLKVTVAVDPGLHDTVLPPLLLLPLVENAVIHGIGPVAIAVRAGADTVEVTVHNTSTTPRQTGSGTSLRDLRRRLAILYGTDGSLTTHRDADGYTARLVVPV